MICLALALAWISGFLIGLGLGWKWCLRVTYRWLLQEIDSGRLTRSDNLGG